MKRAALIVGLLLVVSVTGLVLYGIWPKYGICREPTRYDEIACAARRNLHFSAHFTWSFNRFTVDAVTAEVGQDDIPVLAEMLGDDRAVLRMLAATVLADMGEDGLASLKRAAESADATVRHTARIALMDYEIRNANPPQRD
ncbi:MAG: hypothetical protein QF893_02155 [Alphaproteobacteria bacterium]|jgi:hypothetical protein|nr:hypothetical protein [Alphaproteobacteria bacterium]